MYYQYANYIFVFFIVASTLMLLYNYYSKLKGRLQQQHGGDYKMSNQDIRRTAAGAGVKLWQIADALGMADCSFSRKLRKELPQDEKEKIFSIIQQLAKEVS